jgi:hypothetical protein
MHGEKCMSLEKFSSQAEPEILCAVKELAKQEGKRFQALVNEAFMDLLEKRKQTKPRRFVMEQFQNSLGEYDRLSQ